MARRLVADGVTGKVAIMEGGSRDVFENPTKNLDKIHFHSDLSYLSIIQQINLPGITLPAVTGQWRSVKVGGKKGGSKGSKRRDIPSQTGGTRYHNIGTLLGDPDGPTLGWAEGRPLNSLVLFNTTYRRDNSIWNAYRTVSLCRQGSALILVENWYSVGADIPQQTLSDINIVKFNLMSDQNPNSQYKLFITPERFIASGGKLDSATRYVKRSPTGPYFLFPGRTMDAANAGGRWANIDGTYLEEGGYVGDWELSAPAIGLTI